MIIEGLQLLVMKDNVGVTEFGEEQDVLKRS